ncbi:hypothetical protein EUX98_g4498 [Antrodiella citrinella]|uniref:F-box domain-containing protein n=1 Tax=Antrodiella citrinella TaxID=2447956 RepID=A0A4S4MVS9_9APHY|nr:hypothetical protein EUX98_g4498 [Antrodiella citrinella]
MCNILKKATSLHTLNLYTDFDVGQGIWQAISQSQSLDHLDIRALSAQFHAPVVNKAIFSSLVVLCIETSRLTALITAFKSSTFPYIQEIKCIINTSKQTNHLIKAVADACTANTLRKFHLKSVGDWRSVHEREGLNGAGSDVLRHLFRMRSMRELSLDVGWMWTLGDKFIQGLAQAWPNLTTLWLDPLGIWLQPHRITLGGLQALAVYCPHLIRLGIVLDASNLDFPSFPQPIGQRSMLYELSVGPSQIVSPGIVAGFLSETFPCLASIFLYEYDWDVTPLDPWYVEQWRYADRILKDMSMRRMVRGADVDTLAVAVQNTHL